jgi:hypothetical protein
MRVPGTLAIYGVLLLVIQVAWPFTHRYATLPDFLAGVCLAVAMIWGLVRGSSAVRLSVYLWLCGFAVLYLGLALEPAFMGGPVRGSGLSLPRMNPGLGILSATLFGLGVVLGILAFHAEASAGHQPTEAGPVQ